MYNILWLDDKPIEAMPIIQESYPDRLKIDKVDYIDVCERVIENDYQNYHAVILDANGLKSSAPAEKDSKTGFLPLVRKCKDKGLPVYVFSGQLERGGESDAFVDELNNLGIFENVNFFRKSGGAFTLLDTIIKDLNKDYSVLLEYEDHALLENALYYGVDANTLKSLILWVKDPSRQFPDYTALRRIIFDDIEANLCSIFGLMKDQKFDWKQLTPQCILKWEKETINALYRNLINDNVHGWPEDNGNMQYVIAHSFLIAMDWYNRFMHQYEKDSNPSLYYGDILVIEGAAEDKQEGPKTRPQSETQDSYVGVVEKDYRCKGLYKVGPYLFKSSEAQNCLGKKVRVEKTDWIRSYKRYVVDYTIIDSAPKPTLGDSNPALSALMKTMEK